MCKCTVVVITASLEVIDPCKCISMGPGTLSERSLCVSLGDSSADVSAVVAWKSKIVHICTWIVEVSPHPNMVIQWGSLWLYNTMFFSVKWIENSLIVWGIYDVPVTCSSPTCSAAKTNSFLTYNMQFVKVCWFKTAIPLAEWDTPPEVIVWTFWIEVFGTNQGCEIYI